MACFWKSYWLSLRSILRDRGVLLLVLIGPIIYSFYYPYPYSAELVQDVPVAIVDLDKSRLSRSLIRLADASPDIKVIRVVQNLAAFRQALWEGEIDGGLMIPHGFRRHVMRGEKAQVTVLGNGAYFMLNKAELLGFNGAIQALSNTLDRRLELARSSSMYQAKQRSEPVRLDLRTVSNPMGGYSAYVVPAVAVVVLQQTLLLGMCMLLGTWRELGAPYDVNMIKNRLALVLAAASICFVNVLYYVVLVYRREDYHHLGDWKDLLPVIIIFSLTNGAWTVAIGSWARYREQAMIILLPTTMPIIFLAGFAWPVELIPSVLRAVSLLTPSTAGIQAFLNVDQMGADLIQISPELTCLFLLCAGSLSLIFLKKRWV